MRVLQTNHFTLPDMRSASGLDVGAIVLGIAISRSAPQINAKFSESSTSSYHVGGGALLFSFEDMETGPAS